MVITLFSLVQIIACCDTVWKCNGTIDRFSGTAEILKYIDVGTGTPFDYTISYTPQTGNANNNASYQGISHSLRIGSYFIENEYPTITIQKSHPYFRTVSEIDYNTRFHMDAGIQLYDPYPFVPLPSNDLLSIYPTGTFTDQLFVAAGTMAPDFYSFPFSFSGHIQNITPEPISLVLILTLFFSRKNICKKY